MSIAVQSDHCTTGADRAIAEIIALRTQKKTERVKKIHHRCDSNKIMQIFRGGVGATNLVARRCCVLISGDMVCRPYKACPVL